MSVQRKVWATLLLMHKSNVEYYRIGGYRKVREILILILILFSNGEIMLDEWNEEGKGYINTNI